MDEFYALRTTLNERKMQSHQYANYQRSYQPIIFLVVAILQIGGSYWMSEVEIDQTVIRLVEISEWECLYCSIMGEAITVMFVELFC